MMMRALRQFDYDRRRLYAGDMFEPASDADGRVLALAQLAEALEDARPKSKKQRYKHRALKAEDE